MKALFSNYPIFLIFILSTHALYGGQSAKTTYTSVPKEGGLGDEISKIDQLITRELTAEKINPYTFGAILKLHSKLSQSYHDAKCVEGRTKSHFYTHPSDLSLYRPDFMDCSRDGSFSGRFSKTFCSRKDDQECCYWTALIPCTLAQCVLGCLVPWGYDKHCCLEYHPQEPQFQENKAREYLEALSAIYDSENKKAQDTELEK
ncbi:MAG: hypothetical protein KC505_00530 [Myxococcales bacterium]|nr:hypothetical protein [Myxococcales bacterium]USN51161.1 MAG: hypothetical protein H6731_01755 [Myxococcales bacterium]